MRIHHRAANRDVISCGARGRAHDERVAKIGIKAPAIYLCLDVNEPRERLLGDEKLIEREEVAIRLLIAQDMSGTVCYNEFRSYVDEAYQIVSESEDIPADSTTWGAFNKFSKGELLDRLNVVMDNYKAHKTSWFVATGPFKVTKESPTQIIMEKNPLHWNADNIGFEQIQILSSSDTNQTYNLLTQDRIDYMDGLAPIDTLEAILAQNKQMAHLKMYDPGSIGVLFNMEKTDLWTDKVREAFQYLFNREEIKNLANPYAITSYFPLLGMADSEAQRWMTEEGYDALPRYL